jgi:hypothetical protein
LAVAPVDQAEMKLKVFIPVALAADQLSERAFERWLAGPWHPREQFWSRVHHSLK